MNNLYNSDNREYSVNCSTNNSNEDDLAIAITLSVLDAIIAIIAILGNSLIIFTVRKFRHLRTATNLFVVAISFSDLLTALTIPYYVSFYFDSVSYACIKFYCKLRYLFTMFSTLWSLLLMIGLAIDRYIAVLKPLRYNCLVQRRYVIRSIWISAIYMAIICFIPFCYVPHLPEYKECDLFYIVDVYYAALGVCAHVILTIVVTSILYWKIYREAILHQKKTPNAFHKRWETNMTIMMMLILGVHLITLLPYLIVVMLRYCVPANDCDMQRTLGLVKKFTTVLYFSKSIANPFICAVRNKGFRLAFRHILGYGRSVPKNDFSLQISNIPTRVPHETLF